MSILIPDTPLPIRPSVRVLNRSARSDIKDGSILKCSECDICNKHVRKLQLELYPMKRGIEKLRKEYKKCINDLQKEISDKRKVYNTDLIKKIKKHHPVSTSHIKTKGKMLIYYTCSK
jgi:hypothetical protein